MLQKLSAENRRVLIFTQMASMLDILEAFLDHHQLTYVRLDESLSLEERQVKHLHFHVSSSVTVFLLWPNIDLAEAVWVSGLLISMCFSLPAVLSSTQGLMTTFHTELLHVHDVLST